MRDETFADEISSGRLSEPQELSKRRLLVDIILSHGSPNEPIIRSLEPANRFIVERSVAVNIVSFSETKNMDRKHWNKAVYFRRDFAVYHH